MAFKNPRGLQHKSKTANTFFTRRLNHSKNYKWRIIASLQFLEHQDLFLGHINMNVKNSKFLPLWSSNPDFSLISNSGITPTSQKRRPLLIGFARNRFSGEGVSEFTCLPSAHTPNKVSTKMRPWPCLPIEGVWGEGCHFFPLSFFNQRFLVTFFQQTQSATPPFHLNFHKPTIFYFPSKTNKNTKTNFGALPSTQRRGLVSSKKKHYPKPSQAGSPNK